MDYVKIIDDNKEALLWRLRMIKAARKKIVMIAFKMRNDNSGKDIIAALLDACKRGVQAYILIDALSSELFLYPDADFAAFTAHPNVNFFFYNPVRPGRIRKWSYRMHDKIFQIDDGPYLIGGRNIFDQAIGDYADKYNIDIDVLVASDNQTENSSSVLIKEYAASIFREKNLKRVTGLDIRSTKTQTYDRFDTRFKNLCLVQPFITRGFPDIRKEDFFVADEVTLLHGATDPNKKEPELWRELVSLMNKGENVLVLTPFIMCDDHMYKELKELSNAKENFAIITNAAETGSNFFGCADLMNEKDNIYEKGIRVYECQNDNSFHTKTILIDNNISIIGSFNFDMRSTYIDTELMLVIRSEELNKNLRVFADKLLMKSRHVDKNGNVLQGKDYHDKELDPGKQAFFSILRVLIKPIRKYL